MCAKAIAAFGLSLGLYQEPVQMPRPDQYGRIPTINCMGKCDTSTDPIVEQWIQFAVENANKNPDFRTYKDQKNVMEIGPAYGFTAKRAVDQGSHYILVDACRDHLQIAEHSFDPPRPGQVESRVGMFPWDINVVQLRETYPLVGIAAFKVLHFMTPSQIREFFDVAWDLLDPGGRIYLSAGTPWNRVFRGFPPEYRRKKIKFMRDPLRNPYPGEIPNARRYLPKEIYPDYFHALDADILSHLARLNPHKPFEILHAAYIQRPNPPDQAYRWGYHLGQGEVVGFIVQKPHSSPPVLR